MFFCSQNALGQGCASKHALGQWGVYLSMYWGRGVWTVGRCGQGVVDWMCVERDVVVERGIHPPSETATDAVGTHPTGMHSCLQSEHFLQN